MSALAILIISLIASALTSGTEIAFLSSNKLRMELERKQGGFSARILWGFVKSPAKFIAYLLIANNVALVIYGIVISEDILTADLLKAYLPERMHGQLSILFMQTFISTMIILVSAEFFPKVFFRLDPNRILKVLAVPVRFFYFIFYPVVYIIMGIARFILKNIARVNFIEERPVFGRVDLDFYIRELSSKNSQEEEQSVGMEIFQNALDFTDVKVRECMVPRNEVVAINVDDSIEDLRKRFIETKLSRILVYRDHIDNIIGFAHSNEMFKNPADIPSILLPIIIVPEVMAAHELMQMFIDQHRSIAVVVDEFGGTSGVVTMEDVMEEIFGEIRDEHDTEEVTEKRISKNEYLFSGRLEIDALNRKYDLNIPVSEAYETLGGFILHHYENIPSPKDEIVIPPYLITILQVKENRIEQVRLKVV